MSSYEMGHFRGLSEICIVAKILGAGAIPSIVHESVRRSRDPALGAFNLTLQRFVAKELLWDWPELCDATVAVAQVLLTL
jgi:hypothetical protein